jgi:hypothetical protein
MKIFGSDIILTAHSLYKNNRKYNKNFDLKETGMIE